MRRALYRVATGQQPAPELFANALRTDGEGPFAEHLRHCERSLQGDALRRGLKQVLEHRTLPPLDAHYHLQGLGLIRETARGAEVRNQLYARFFRDRIGG